MRNYAHGVNRKDIEKKLLVIIQEKGILENPPAIDFDASLQERYGVSSINFIEMIIALEEEYGIEFGDNELTFTKIKTCNMLIDTLLTRLAAQTR